MGTYIFHTFSPNLIGYLLNVPQFWQYLRDHSFSTKAQQVSMITTEFWYAEFWEMLKRLSKMPDTGIDCAIHTLTECQNLIEMHQVAVNDCAIDTVTNIY